MKRFLGLVGVAVFGMGLALWAQPPGDTPTNKKEPQRVTRPKPAADAGRVEKKNVVAADSHQRAVPVPVADAGRVEKKNVVAGPSEAAARSRVTRDLLDRRVVVELPADQPLQDLLEIICGKVSQLRILIDDSAYRSEPDLKDQYPDGIERLPLKLPKMTDMRAGDIVHLALNSVDSTFIVRDGTVVIVPQKFISSGRVLQQPVNITFDRTPLVEALDTLAGRTGATIVLDRRQGEITAPVTATFDSVPVEAAVRLLTNMCELRLMRVGGALYVTSQNNAEVLRAELKRDDHGLGGLQPPKQIQAAK